MPVSDAQHIGDSFRPGNDRSKEHVPISRSTKNSSTFPDFAVRSRPIHARGPKVANLPTIVATRSTPFGPDPIVVLGRHHFEPANFGSTQQSKNHGAYVNTIPTGSQTAVSLSSFISVEKGVSNETAAPLAVDAETTEFVLQSTKTESTHRATDVPRQTPFSVSPRELTGQVAEAIKIVGDKVIDVQLSPKELGHIRLLMSHAEAGLMIAIHAERPETMELIRRHIDLLTQDLRIQGHQNINYSFADEKTGDQNRPSPRENQSLEQGVYSEKMNPVQNSHRTTHQSEGLDLRL